MSHAEIKAVLHCAKAYEQWIILWHSPKSTIDMERLQRLPSGNPR